MEFEQVIAFEVEGNSALQQVGLDGYDLRIVETGPQGNFDRSGREIRPIDDCGLLISHTSHQLEKSSGRV